VDESFTIRSITINRVRFPFMPTLIFMRQITTGQLLQVLVSSVW